MSIITLNIDCCEGGCFDTINYGFLYNWYVIEDSREIANIGWHVPTNSEYETFRTYVASQGWNYDGTTTLGFVYDNKQGKAIAEPGSWVSSVVEGAVGNSDYISMQNISMWNGKPSGRRYSSFSEGGEDGAWWGAEEVTLEASWYVYMNYNISTFFRGNDPKYVGYGLRLVKDSTVLSHGETSTMTGNDGKVYRTICVGTQEWLADNLAETKFRNGDWITGFDGGVYTLISDVDWAAKTTEAMCVYNDDLNNM